MNKTIAVLCCALAVSAAFAGPGFRPGPRPAPHHFRPVPPHRPGPFRPAPLPPHHRYRPSPGFWPGLIGGVVLGAALAAPAAPVVVAQPQPVVVAAPPPARVWVEGRYVDQVQPNGVVVRVWRPGHWEVLAQ